MNKVLLTGILFFVSLIFTGTAYAEDIASFDVSYVIRVNGTVDVEEVITYDFGDSDRHGIFRTIPYLRVNEDGKKFRIEYSNFSITDGSGNEHNFEQSTEDDSVLLKIGDANRFVTGQREYRIAYSITGGITYFSDHDEFYWNATGNEWTVPIKASTVNITLPDTNPALIDVVCYTGSAGSVQSDCAAEKTGSTVSVSTTAPLPEGAGLTVAVRFPKDLVEFVPAREYVPFVETFWGKIITRIFFGIVILFLAGWYAVLPVFIIWQWWKKGRDPKPPMGETNAWFDVPKNRSLRPFTPGEVGTLIDEHVDMRDITATIVDLARRGHIKIRENAKNDFTFIKTPISEHLFRHEKLLFDGIFKSGDVVRIKETSFADTVEKVKKRLYDLVVEEELFDKNPQSARNIYYILASIALFTFNLPLALISFIFGRAMPRKTLYGAQSAVIARSLKNFLVSQEHQLTFQAKNQMFFEKMLPYAVAFGVEKIWAERFKDIAMTQPDWYEGSSGRAFNSVLLANSLSNSMSRFSSAATPTRSSSGFSSGFSGGSSGGGGGGGGGGSW